MKDSAFDALVDILTTHGETITDITASTIAADELRKADPWATDIRFGVWTGKTVYFGEPDSQSRLLITAVPLNPPLAAFNNVKSFQP